MKPSPDNIQELYLQSLAKLGINEKEHDIRFVEDNWESPTLGAWGLGWEVWLDGMEITQFTYFQQVGSVDVKPVASEITYGLERIAMYIQEKENVYDIDWNGTYTYGDVFHQNEFEQSTYNFELADTALLFDLFDKYEKEAVRVIELGYVHPAYDYVLKCSHTFNLLDSRGAISVSERTAFISRVRNLARLCAQCYLKQREELGLSSLEERSKIIMAKDLLLEIGTEEVPAHFMPGILAQLKEKATAKFQEMRLDFDEVTTLGTPRRTALLVKNLAETQQGASSEYKGPSTAIAFDKDGNPTKAAIGFARGKKVDVADLVVKDGYVYAVSSEEGKQTVELLPTLLKELVEGLNFPKNMRWGDLDFRFVRPLRWLVALYDEEVIDFTVANVTSGRVSRGHRFLSEGDFTINKASDYEQACKDAFIIVDQEKRRDIIKAQIEEIAKAHNGHAEITEDLLEEVIYLVEYPTALCGTFEDKYLKLPKEAVMTPMRDHQRYFPVLDDNNNLLPLFITVRNGGDYCLDKVQHGNERVLRARLADAQFFFDEDRKHSLYDYVEKLKTVVFQEGLGTIYDKLIV